AAKVGPPKPAHRHAPTKGRKDSHHDERKATITENAATVCGTGRARRAGEGLLEGGRHQEEGRPTGSTLAEIVKATDWQKHSIRGFLSTAAKKHGLKIESTKTEAGDRIYQ